MQWSIAEIVIAIIISIGIITLVINVLQKRVANKNKYTK